MQKSKQDRRVRKTKKVLLESLTKLMSEKKINNITVTELTKLADVNRSTFYLYYTDIFDMLEKVENEMLDEFKNAFYNLLEDSCNYATQMFFFTYMFSYIKENAQMCKILLGPDGDNAFIEKFKDLIIHTKPKFDKAIPQVKVNYIRPFIISGCIGITQHWLENDLKESPEEMSVIIIEIVQDIVNNYV